jgi:hypothetical protein
MTLVVPSDSYGSQFLEYYRYRSAAKSMRGRLPMRVRLASWQDSQYCLNLVRTASSDRFGLLIYSKRMNAEAELGLVEAARFENEQAPAREAERQRKEPTN